MKQITKHGTWRIDWEGRDGCIRQEWFRTSLAAKRRALKLWRGHIDSQCFREFK